MAETCTQSIAFRVGRNAAALNQPCFGQSRRMNRVVKARAVKAVGLRQQRKAVSPQSPPSPNQVRAGVFVALHVACLYLKRQAERTLAYPPAVRLPASQVAEP